jgi:hypothetical protein
MARRVQPKQTASRTLCFGKTPMPNFLDAKPIAEEKMQQDEPGRPSRRWMSDKVLAFTL